MQNPRANLTKRLLYSKENLKNCLYRIRTSTESGDEDRSPSARRDHGARSDLHNFCYIDGSIQFLYLLLLHRSIIPAPYS